MRDYQVEKLAFSFARRRKKKPISESHNRSLCAWFFAKPHSLSVCTAHERRFLASVRSRFCVAQTAVFLVLFCGLRVSMNWCIFTCLFFEHVQL